jgi:exosortase
VLSKISNSPRWNAGETSLLLHKNMFRTVICLLLLAGYLPVFSLYARQHWNVSNLQGAYEHAPLTLCLLVYLVWRQRGKLLVSTQTLLNPGGLLMLILGVALKIYGDVHGYVVLQGLSLIPVLYGLLMLYHKPDSVRTLRFPILFLFFIVPLPAAAIDALTLPLVKVTAEIVTAVLPIFSIDVVKAGQVLTVNAHNLAEFHEIILAPECSGIRSFISLLALSSLFLHFQGRNFKHSTMVMLATVPLVILGNCFRVTLTVLMIVYVSPDTAQNFFHWSSGVLLFTVTLLGLFLVDALVIRGTTRMGSANA